MATEIINNGKLWLAGYDLSGDMSAFAVNYGCETQDDTTINETTRSNKGGLKTVEAQHEGFWQAGTGAVEDVLWANIAVADVPMTASNGDDGDRAYTFLSNLSSYSPGGAIGDMLKFSVSGSATGDLVRGTIMINGSAITATGNGTARQLGAVGAAEKLYAALHVTSVSGTSPTLDVTVESDDNSGMTTSATRITFTQATAIGSEWATPVSGAITDDWWRIDYTIGGTDTPTFDFVVVLGIQ